MAKGDVLPSESSTAGDPVTAVRVRQVTSHPSLHHHPFCYVPAYDDAMRWLFFVSHRTGSPQIFVEDRAAGELRQLTERADLNEWSIHPAHDGRFVYFTAGNGGYRVEISSCLEERVADLSGTEKAPGMVAAGMGTTTLSRDDRWWAIPVRRSNTAQLLVIDTINGQQHVLCENASIGHPQFHPDDANLLRYAGPYDRRIWVVSRDGSRHELAYLRDDAKREWIVHECWRPNSREILTANWPHGVMSIDIDTHRTRWVARFNAWHPMVDRTGLRMVTDTKHPDIGLQLFDILDEPSPPRLLCASHASSAGDHWNNDHCPYDDGPVEVYAPQHTHPHPAFSPCGSCVVFTSDRSGHAQVYEVECPPGTIPGDDNRAAS